ncbi:MAG: iron-sulfur cluster assembly accessory protein [Rhodothermia bacterium]|nr:iron-sulfur cluster assembly accessory protein [Rhodothermia bacterium]
MFSPSNQTTGSYVSGATTNTGTASPPKSAPPVRLTPKAVDEVRKLIKTKNVPEGFGLRVGVRGGGCSGMSYILGFDKQREHDLRFELDDLTLIMDRRHGLYLMGTTVDYHDGLDARGFTFENPNAASSCGCGSSFGV